MNKQSDITEDIITWTVIILLVSRTGRFLGLLYQTEMELYVPPSSLLKQNTIEWLREGKEIESLQMLVETVPRFDLAFVLFSSIFQTERAKTLSDVYSHIIILILELFCCCFTQE